MSGQNGQGRWGNPQKLPYCPITLCPVAPSLVKCRTCQWPNRGCNPNLAISSPRPLPRLRENSESFNPPDPSFKPLNPYVHVKGPTTPLDLLLKPLSHKVGHQGSPTPKLLILSSTRISEMASTVGKVCMRLLMGEVRHELIVRIDLDHHL
jgi:hypothetical protein